MNSDRSPKIWELVTLFRFLRYLFINHVQLRNSDTLVIVNCDVDSVSRNRPGFDDEAARTGDGLVSGAICQRPPQH